MYPVVGTCMGCGEENHIFDYYCLECFEKEKKDFCKDEHFTIVIEPDGTTTRIDMK